MELGMKCPTCGGEIDDQAQRNDGTALGMGEDLFGPLAVAGEPKNGDVEKTSKAARRTQLSATWQPTEAQQLYCRQQGKDPQAMAEAFKGYYLAKGSIWKDWGLVWMRACRDWNTTPQIAQRNGTTIKDQTLSLWELRLSCKTWNAFWGPRVGEPGCQVPKELW